MDAQVAAISTSLDALRAQHERAAAAERAPRIFTNAVLNPARIDILELIRDADALEASLFVNAPADDADERDGPRPRQVQPIEVPSPLRRGSTDVPSLLAAAERVIQHYHKAPRARRHIKALFQRHDELQRHIARYTSTIDNVQHALADKKPGRLPRREDPELRQVRDEIQRERMEIVALEGMLAELEDARACRAPPAAATPGPAPRSPPLRTPATEAFRSAAAGQTPRMPTASKSSAFLRRMDATPLARTPLHTQSPLRASQSPLRASQSPLRTSQSPLRTSQPSPLHASQPSPRRAPHSPAPRLTQSVAGSSPARSPKASPSSSPGLLTPPGTVPSASAHLEEIAARIWERFGENLRYACPGCASASFVDTFHILAALERGGRDAPAALGGGAAGPAPTAPLSVGIAFMAHVLLLLVRSAPPHTLALADIKRVSETWWSRHGRAAFMEAAGGEPPNDVIRRVGYDTAGNTHTGSQLATTAVYGLVAKKLLRIHRSGGAPSVRFS